MIYYNIIFYHIAFMLYTGARSGGAAERRRPAAARAQRGPGPDGPGADARPGDGPQDSGLLLLLSSSL